MSDQMDIKQVNVEVRGLPKFAWLIWVVAGAVSSVVGFWLLLSPKVAIATLAILVAIGLIFNGIGEIATAAQSRYPVVNYIIGVVFVVAGLMVFLRPSGPTAALNFLALLVGFTMILTGIGEMVVALLAATRSSTGSSSPSWERWASLPGSWPHRGQRSRSSFLQCYSAFGFCSWESLRLALGSRSNRSQPEQAHVAQALIMGLCSVASENMM